MLTTPVLPRVREGVPSDGTTFLAGERLSGMSNESFEPRRRRIALGALTAVGALVLGACSSGDDDTAEPTTTTTATAEATTTTASEAAEPTTTTAASDAAGPVIADGEAWIAYQGVELGIKLTRPDGTASHVILGPPGDQVHFDWSPDGSEIAYVQVADTGQTVMVTDLQGQNPRPLVATFPPELDGLMWEDPAWSRDGTEVAMVGYDGDPQNSLPARSLLVIVDVATGDLTVAGELVSAEGALHSFPRWSPEGDALVLNVDRFEGEALEFVGSTVDIIRRSGNTWSAPESITDVGRFSRVDWHPTEDLIIFGDHDIGYEESTDEPTNLFTIRPDGTELTQITSFGPGEARASQPTWTSDGRIIFTHVTGDDDETREIAVIDADGSGLEVVVPAAEIGDFNRPHPRLRPLRSDDGDASVESSSATSNDLTAYCDDVITLDQMFQRFDAEDPTAFEAALAEAVPVTERIVAAAPADVADEYEIMFAAFGDVVDSGDPTPFFTPEVDTADAAVHAHDLASCGWTVAEIAAEDFQYAGSFPTEAGPTSFELTNTGSEAHALIVARKLDNIEGPALDAFNALQSEEDLASVFEDAVSIFTEPGDADYGLVNLAPGEYIAYCPIPSGTTGEASIGDGPPHFTHGEITSFEVSSR